MEDGQCEVLRVEQTQDDVIQDEDEVAEAEDVSFTAAQLRCMSSATFQEVFDRGNVECPYCWEVLRHSPDCETFDQYEEFVGGGTAAGNQRSDPASNYNGSLAQHGQAGEDEVTE